MTETDPKAAKVQRQPRMTSLQQEKPRLAIGLKYGASFGRLLK
jgi:hypothetical protein